MQKTEKPEVPMANIIDTLIVMNRGNFVIECGRELEELTESLGADILMGTPC